jgi:competence protein ComEA
MRSANGERGGLNLALLAAIAVAIALLATQQRAPSHGLEIVRGTPPAGIDAVLVHVSGAVRSPGVVEAARGDRVADVVDRAGGFTDDADPAAVNLARRVRDEDQVHIPSLGEGSRLLDLNRATAAELEALPGIGEVYAARIIEARDTLPFATGDDLLAREIVPAATYEGIRDLVTALP